jgi:hypothetical protein
MQITNWLAKKTDNLGFFWSKQYIKKLLAGKIYFLYYKKPQGYFEKKAKVIPSSDANGTQLVKLFID